MVAQGKLNLPLWLSTTTTTSYMEKLAYFAISVKITYGSASTARPITIARFAISKLISLPSNRLCIAQNPCSSIVMTFVCRKIGKIKSSEIFLNWMRSRTQCTCTQYYYYSITYYLRISASKKKRTPSQKRYKLEGLNLKARLSFSLRVGACMHIL